MPRNSIAGFGDFGIYHDVRGGRKGFVGWAGLPEDIVKLSETYLHVIEAKSSDIVR